MKYIVTVSEGCVADNIDINGKSYSGEDKRYCLSDEERKEFNIFIISKIERMFKDGNIGIYDLLYLIQPDDIEYSPTCETCFDRVTTSTYNLCDE
jgi:hypothetical protein